MFHVKRAYNRPSPSDGVRILVDGLWPRGISKESLKADMWLKDVAPSAALRKWFSHKTERWPEFQRRYIAELKAKPEAWKPILESAKKHEITLLFGSKDVEHNNAVVLENFLRSH